MNNENEHEIVIAEQHEDNSQLNEQEQQSEQHEHQTASFYLSELIAKSVLDKLITNAVLQEYILMTEEKVGDHCFTFIKKSLNQFLEQRFFQYEFNLDENNNEYFYDDADDDVDNTNTTSTMYYNCVHSHISNTWIEIPEPEAQATDRNTTSKMKITKNFTEDFHTLSDDEQVVTLNTKEPESSLPNNYMPSQNDIVHEEKEKETISMNNTLTQSKQHQTEKLIIKAKNTIPSTTKRKLKLNNTKQTNNNNNVNSDNDIDKIPPIDLPSYDLPESMFYNKYIEQDNTAEINHMRKEFEAEKHRKEEEIKQEQALQLKKKRAALVAANYNKKEIDTNHYTFDSSGKVIPLKHQNVELLAKEFWWAKPFIKGGIQRLGSIFRPKIERKGSYKGVSPTKKGKDNNDNNKRRKKSHGDVDLIRRGVFLEDNNNNNNNNKGKANVNVNTEVIRNDDRAKHPNDYYDIRYSKMKHIKKGPIVTSGNNYSLITPEIGVIITQDDKHKKEGGFEFSQKFNKPSMFEFSRLAMESERYNSQRYLLSSMSIDSQSVNGLNSYIGYKKQFGSENPLIQNANVRDDDSRVTSSYKLPSLYQSANYNYHNNKLLMNSEMKLTNVDIPHVKYVLDDVGCIESNMNTQMKGKIITNENIFRNQRRRRKDDQLYLNTEPINNNYMYDMDDDGNYMDKFNTKIIRNKYWGNNQQQPNSASTNTHNGGSDYVNTKSWKKPNKRINIKELGYRIAMTKMPRDRRLYKSVVLSNEGYNK